MIEVLTWVELPAVWYALKRNADYSPDGPYGKKTHISYALWLSAIPAYVMTPDASEEVTSVVSYKDLAPSEDTRVAFEAISSRIRVVDGIVIDPNAKWQAGPNAVILPPKNATGAAQ